MSRPRILITNFHPTLSGGHASSISRLCTSWLKEIYEFRVAVPQTSDIYKLGNELGFNVSACDFPTKLKELPQIIRNIKKFREIVTEFKPNIVHCNGGADLALAAWALALRPDIKIVRHHRAVRHLSNDVYHRWLYSRRVTENVYVSKGAMDLCHSAGLVPNTPCNVIYNGIDTNFFSPRPPDTLLREKLGINRDDFVFGSCAGLGSYKRVDLIIKAASQLRHQYKFKILLLGPENQFSRHKNFAISLGVADRLIYGGRQTDVRPYIALFDVGFVLSDRIETLSNAVREMMSMGKPMLSSSYTGLKENFRDNEEGFFISPGNFPDLLATMERFLTQSLEIRASMGNKARIHAEKFFDREVTLRPMNELYKRCLK